MKILNQVCSSQYRWIAMIIGMLMAISVANAQSFKVKVVGTGQPAILIPGLTCSGDVWDETTEALSDYFECHILTLPGFAGQPALEDMPEHWLNAMRDEIYQYVVDKELKSPVFIGHSLGGFLSLSLGSTYPELPSKIMIVDALPFLPASMNPDATVESAKAFADEQRQLMKQTSTPEAQEARQRQILAYMISDQERIAEALVWGMESEVNTVAQSMYELSTTDLRENLKNIKAPTLVLGSWIAYKNFGFTQEAIEKRFVSQYANLEGVKVEISPIGRHFIMWDDPDFYFEQVNNFLLVQP